MDGNSRAVLIKKMAIDQIPAFCDERIQCARDATAVDGEERSAADDIRTLSIKYTASGARRRVFKESIGELIQTEMEDFPYEPRTCLPYLQAIVNVSEALTGNIFNGYNRRRSRRDPGRSMRMKPWRIY